jgi:chitin synthase
MDSRSTLPTVSSTSQSTTSLGKNLKVPAPAPVQDNALVEQEQIKRGKRKVGLHKYMMALFVLTANFMLIFASWWWPSYYYAYLPFITLPLALNCIMIFNICVWQLKNLIKKPVKVIPQDPESMILLMPCYNETKEECTKSLDSLVEQVGIDHHKKAIMIVCDGKVRGVGMEKTTGQYLNEDILVDQVDRKIMRGAYVAWDGQSMDVEVTRGTYRGVPFFCIVKQQNQGKRDSLIVCRSFLYNFNIRQRRPNVIFRPDFFSEMSNWLVGDAGIDRVDILIGMDADTVFAPDCITNLLEESHYPHTVGVCGYVAVDFTPGNWNVWSLYQSTEYTIAQALRRLHQSIVTHKVSCLPGCCQLLRICEETCGDRVLIELFGYHPQPTDGMLKRIRATASEDRNHVCLMLMNRTHAQTRQALRARAYTDVPRSTSVFLSQRRRWTLGATSNDLMLFTSAPLFRFNIWERIVAFQNVLTWCLNFFVIASIACMINAFLHQPLWVIMAFASIMFVPLTYYVIVAIWLPRSTLERCQYLLGLLMFTTCGPFINISVSLYAIAFMDNFGWGKTRKVVSEDNEKAEGAAEVEKPVAIHTVPDVENQVGPNLRMPYRAPPGDRAGLVSSSGSSESVVEETRAT